MSEKYSDWLKTLNTEKIDFLNALKNFKLKTITLDLDQVMADSQIPVIKRAGMLTKRDYSKKSLQKFGDVETWLQEDLGMSAEDAMKQSWHWWTDPECLSEAKPNEPIREYTKQAAFRNINQYVVTGRKASLRQSTNEWIGLNYPWIDLNKIKITQNNNDLFDPYHKVNTLLTLKPDVHFEDSVSDIEKILNSGIETNVLWFARPLEYGQINHRQVIPVPSMDIFNSFINA